MKTNLCRALLLLFVVVAVSGCTGGGGGGSATSALSTSQDVSLSAFSTETGTPEVPSSGEEVALVHNPEPASVLLFGLGALGLLRRKKIAAKHQNLKKEGGVK